MAKTLLISEIFPPKTGGSGRWFWEIYRRLPRGEYAIACGEDSRQAGFDSGHDLEVYRLPLGMREWGIGNISGLRGYGRALLALSRLVSTQGVELVHCGRCLPEGVMALSLKLCKRIPYVSFVHGEDVSTALSSREHRWLVTQVLRHAKFLIANSQNTLAMLRDDWGVESSRLRLLYPGVDIQRFVPAGHCEAVRSGLGWKDRAVVLTVGRLQRRKGHDQMIKALSSVRKVIPGVLYSIVGDGEDRTYLEHLTAAEGVSEHVQFRGESSDADLVNCYQQCDLFVLANRQVGRDVEGFGMVLLEAQACGKPVVAGASGGTAETMKVPETGRVIPCDGPQELANTVIELLNNPRLREAMGTAGREWVERQFGWDSLSEQAAALFGSKSRMPAETVVPTLV